MADGHGAEPAADEVGGHDAKAQARGRGRPDVRQEVLGQERDRDDGVEGREGQLADASFQCACAEVSGRGDEGVRVPDAEVGAEVGTPAWVEPGGADDGDGADEEDYEGVGDPAECRAR